jgi:predicted DNA binding CopG/RHH family protein
MRQSNLSSEEKDILHSFEKEEWIPVADLPKRKKELTEYARNTLRKDRRLNIRISERDLLELQKKQLRKDYRIKPTLPVLFTNILKGLLLSVRSRSQL